MFKAVSVQLGANVKFVITLIEIKANTNAYNVKYFIKKGK